MSEPSKRAKAEIERLEMAHRLVHRSGYTDSNRLWLAVALDDAFRAGAEAMREKAAKQCHRVMYEASNELDAAYDRGYCAALDHVEADIRAMPVPEPGEEESNG